MIILDNMQELAELIPDAQYYYNEPHRHYHTWDHIVEMFSVAQDMDVPLCFSQKLAILYHDVVYIPGCHDNEELSVELMHTAIKKASPDLFTKISSYLSQAETIIRDTKDHHPSINESTFVIDLDFYRLSVEPEKFALHIEAIENEYCRYSSKEFKEGQLKFYKKLLEKNRIFSFAAFDDQQAKDNLQSRVAKLEAPFTSFLSTIPGPRYL